MEFKKNTRDSARTASIRQIQSSLEAYKAIHGVYPATSHAGTNLPSGFTGMWGIGYGYSIDTAGNWMKSLKDSDIVKAVPVDPINNTSHYFTYWSSTSYGACKQPFYMLAVIGYEDPDNIPADSKTLICTEGSTTAHWSAGANRAVFSNITR